MFVLSWPAQLLVSYCGVIVVASVMGGVATSAIRITHTWLQLLVSFVGGLMLGVGILHQWPHAAALLVDTDPSFALNLSSGCMMLGLLAMFFLLRTFHFHHHEPFEPAGPPMPAVHHHDHDHSHDHGHHHHDHDHDHAGPAPGIHGVSWAGVTFGLCLHTILDGVALASAVQSDALQHPGLALLGFGTFLGIAFHKPLDSLSITSLMLAGGWSAKSRAIVNFSYALMCPLGAALFMLGLKAVTGREAVVASAALAFSAGVFISIALSDLLPEVQFHSHDRVKLSAALLLGVIVAWGIGFAEPMHAHGKRRQPIPAKAAADDGVACFPRA